MFSCNSCYKLYSPSYYLFLSLDYSKYAARCQRYIFEVFATCASLCCNFLQVVDISDLLFNYFERTNFGEQSLLSTSFAQVSSSQLSCLTCNVLLPMILNQEHPLLLLVFFLALFWKVAFFVILVAITYYYAFIPKSETNQRKLQIKQKTCHRVPRLQFQQRTYIQKKWGKQKVNILHKT